jgi:glycine oxidase
MKNHDVIIVGSGIIGGAIAFELAQRGVRVLLLDRQRAGEEASWAAAGMLTPSPETPDALAIVPLAKASLALYSDFVAAVEAASGMETGYRRDGSLVAFFAENAERELSTFLAVNHGVGLAAEAIRAEDARAMEPALNPAARAAAWLPEEGTVDNRALTRAVLAAALASGAVLRENAAVQSLVMQPNRCAGVVANGDAICAETVVIAAGSFSSQIEGAAPYAPAHPVRGQMLALRGESVKLGHVIRSEHGYLVPRPDGRILAGSTLENAGFEKAVTPAGLQKILAAAVEIAPVLSSAAIIETWSGLRPGTPDHLPILGPTDIEGLVVATGHYRNGILLAPITAKLIREWILETKTSLPIDDYSPMRFLKRASAFVK